MIDVSNSLLRIQADKLQSKMKIDAQKLCHYGAFHSFDDHKQPTNWKTIKNDIELSSHVG